MLWLRVVVGVLAVVSACQDEYDHQELLGAVAKAGLAASKLMDCETFQDFVPVQRKIFTAVENAKMNDDQRFSTFTLLWVITRGLQAGKIQIHHIKYFINYINSGKLDELLTTWDIQHFVGSKGVPGVYELGNKTTLLILKP